MWFESLEARILKSIIKCYDSVHFHWYLYQGNGPWNVFFFRPIFTKAVNCALILYIIVPFYTEPWGVIQPSCAVSYLTEVKKSSPLELDLLPFPYLFRNLFFLWISGTIFYEVWSKMLYRLFVIPEVVNTCRK